MRFWQDDPTEVDVVWYFTDQSTPFLPFYTRFASGNWANQRADWEGVGEVLTAPRPWRNGAAPLFLNSDSYCGTPTQFAEGEPAPRVPPTPVLRNGVIPCCLPNVALWLRPDDIPLSNPGPRVDNWLDASTNGRDYKNPFTLAAPFLGTDDDTGLAVAVFPFGSSLASDTLLSMVGQWTVFLYGGNFGPFTLPGPLLTGSGGVASLAPSIDSTIFRYRDSSVNLFPAFILGTNGKGLFWIRKTLDRLKGGFNNTTLIDQVSSSNAELILDQLGRGNDTPPHIGNAFVEEVLVLNSGLTDEQYQTCLNYFSKKYSLTL